MYAQGVDTSVLLTIALFYSLLSSARCNRQDPYHSTVLCELKRKADSVENTHPEQNNARCRPHTGCEMSGEVIQLVADTREAHS